MAISTRMDIPHGHERGDSGGVSCMNYGNENVEMEGHTGEQGWEYYNLKILS